MASDASIYSMMRQPAPQANPLEMMGQQLQLRNMLDQSQLGQMQRQQLQTSMDDDAGVKNFYSNLNGADPRAKLGDLMRVSPKAGMAAQKFYQESDKSAAELQKTRLENVNKSLSINRELLTTVNDPQGAAMWVRRSFDDPNLSPLLQRIGSPDEIIARIPQDPAQFQQWKMQNGLSIEKLMEMTKPDYKTVAAGGTTEVRQMNPNAPGFSAAPIAHTATPGDLLTDKRSREVAAETRRHNQITEGNQAATLAAGKWQNDLERGVQVNMGTGETRPITADGAPVQRDPKLTESQGKATGFSLRARESADILAGLEKAGTYGGAANFKEGVGGALERVPVVGTALSGPARGALNLTLTAPQQKYEQAKRDFINAVLRVESGATIQQSEFDNADRQYFPQAGDGDEVKAQKKANRENAINALKSQAGPGVNKIPASRTPAGSSGGGGNPPPPRGGIRFLGFEG